LNIDELDFAEEGTAVSFGFGIVYKNATTFAGNLFAVFDCFGGNSITFTQRRAATNTGAFGEKPSLDWGDNVLEHNSIIYDGEFMLFLFVQQNVSDSK
jgi:hypothetical protein